MTYDFTVVGSGIVGLSVGLTLTKQFKGAKVLILEKESCFAKHQTGRNSGVIHSGIYYKPGSLKARLAKEGNKQIVEFSKKHNIPYEVCGKLIVAKEKKELSNLNKLYQLGLENGLSVEKVDEKTIKYMEPSLKGIAGIYVQSTGIVDYKKVSETFVNLIKEQGGEILLGEEVKQIHKQKSEIKIKTSNKTIITKYLINCAGLMSDKVAKMSGVHTDMEIVPFRGEYYELKSEKSHLVKNLIYPVPDPDFPFLGVHFTRTIDDRVLVGPNAVLSLKREGYKKTSFNLKDTFNIFSFPGFWRLASKNMKEGLREMYRSFNKQSLLREVQSFIPEITARDLIPADRKSTR